MSFGIFVFLRFSFVCGVGMKEGMRLFVFCVNFILFALADFTADYAADMTEYPNLLYVVLPTVCFRGFFCFQTIWFGLTGLLVDFFSLILQHAGTLTCTRAEFVSRTVPT